jgi:predicted transcriptional regulator
MAAVVFSIKPQFTDLIFGGQKIFEYRKRQIKREDIDKIIIYATSPISKIVGEAKIKRIIVDTPAALWYATSQFSGIDKKFYDEYFSKCGTAIAYELCDVLQYNKPKSLNEVGLTFAPQSFAYLA